MEDESDEQIWARVVAGDARAYGLIWDRHRARVRAHARTVGTLPDDVDDIAALAFLELWRKRSSVRFVDGSVLPWLLVTAHNVARNASRARRRHRDLLAKLPPPDVAADPAELVAARDTPRARFVREVLEAARPADRDLVVLTAVEGFTVAEAARAVGLTEPAARMRLSRLRARLNAAAHPLTSASEGGAS